MGRRGLAIVYGAPFRLLRFGHLLHHARNGEPGDRWDLFDPRQGSLGWARTRFYMRLCCGLYLAEILSCIPLLGPHRIARRFSALSFDGYTDASAWADKLFASAAESELRIDAGLILVTLAIALSLYGRHWPALALALGVRSLMVSLADNALHYGAPIGHSAHAYDTRLTTPLAALILNGNLHWVHHEAPHLPWRDLPSRLAARNRAPDRGYLSCLFRQFWGPVPIATGEGPYAARTG